MALLDLASHDLACVIDPLGAELRSLTGGDGHEWLWDGDAAWWSGRAPILFPIIGMLRDGTFRWQGRTYPLEKHGFARRRLFTVVARDRSTATLRLTADEVSRALYPFDFTLDLQFALTTNIVMSATVSNRGDGPMPFSFGFHPALRRSVSDDAHLAFDSREQGPVWRMDRDGLLDRSEPLPGDGRRLDIDDALFTDDAMILRDVASRGLDLACGRRRVRIEWENLPDLGLWTKPGAPFLCIEPWSGFNDPADFVGDLGDKPGIVMLQPGSSWTASMTIHPD